MIRVFAVFCLVALSGCATSLENSNEEPKPRPANTTEVSTFWISNDSYPVKVNKVCDNGRAIYISTIYGAISSTAVDNAKECLVK
jgi:hypothetical protein